MPNESHFPSSKREALAMLYVQSENLSGKSPEDLVDLYTEAYDRICARFKAIREEKRDTNN